MSELIVRATTRVSASPAYVGCVGEDARRTSWAWLAPERSGAPANGHVEVPEDRLLPCPSDVPPDRLPMLLAYWPAWRVTEWAGLEIGSGVLIVGSGGLATQVARLSRCRGVLWRAICGSRESRADAEYWIPSGRGLRVDEVLRALPARADSVVLLEGAAGEFGAGLGLCRDGGTLVLVSPLAGHMDLNLYPDLHRRGLRVRAGSPFDYEAGDAEAWRRGAQGLSALIGLGRLAPLLE